MVCGVRFLTISDIMQFLVLSSVPKTIDNLHDVLCSDMLKINMLEMAVVC